VDTSHSQPLRIVFAGTPEFSAIHLKALLDDDKHQIVAVYTQPDRPAGRGKKLTASPVKQLAETQGIDVFQPQSLKSAEAQQELANLNADVMVVVAYGLLLPEAILETPRYGCINVHASLLPRWRGAAPIQRSIEAGDRETGVTIMQMDKGLDTGDMLNKVQFELAADETSTTLHDRLAEAGAPALLETLQQIQSGSLQPEKQDDNLSTYAGKITKEEAMVDWSQPATTIERQVRAFNPFPISYSLLGDARVRIWQAQAVDNQYSQTPGTIVEATKEGIVVTCSQGALRLLNIQLPGKKALPVAEVLNAKGELFTEGSHFQATTD